MCIEFFGRCGIREAESGKPKFLNAQVTTAYRRVTIECKVTSLCSFSSSRAERQNIKRHIRLQSRRRRPKVLAQTGNLTKHLPKRPREQPELLKQNNNLKPQNPHTTGRPNRVHGEKRERKTSNLGENLPAHRPRQMVRTIAGRRKRTNRTGASRNPPKLVQDLHETSQRPSRRTKHKQNNPPKNLPTRNNDLKH